MGLSDLFGPPSAVAKVADAITNNKAQELDDKTLSEFATVVLMPIKGRLDEVLKLPENKHLLANKPQFLSIEDLRAFSVADADKATKLRLMAQAMLVHTGYQDTFAGVDHVTGRVSRYFNGDGNHNRETITDYLQEVSWKRTGAWFHDAVAVGIWRKEGPRSYRLLPIDEATDNARAFLVERAASGKGINDGGMVIEIPEEDLKPNRDT